MPFCTIYCKYGSILLSRGFDGVAQLTIHYLKSFQSVIEIYIYNVTLVLMPMEYK